MNVEDYKKGFRDGASIERGCPQTVYIMGYSFDKIIELIQKDEMLMANRLMTKSEAEEYCRQNGYKLFIDMCIRDSTIIEDDPKLVVHFEETTSFHGTIRLQTTQNGLELWVGGKLKYQWCNDKDK